MSHKCPNFYLFISLLLFVTSRLSADTIALDVGTLNYKEIKTSVDIDSKSLSLKNTITAEQSLQQQNQIVVNKNGAAGRYSTVFLQGSQSSHVLTLKNNFRSSDPSLPSRVFNFGDSVHGLTDSIKVIQGPDSIEYGTDALAGVIRLDQDFSPVRSHSFDVMLGSFNSKKYQLKSEGPKSEVSLTQLSTGGVSEVEAPSGEADGYRALELEGAFKALSGDQFRFIISNKLSDLDDYLTEPYDDPNYHTKDSVYGLNWQKNIARKFYLGVSFQQFERRVENQPDNKSSKSLKENYSAQSHQVFFKAKDLNNFLDFGLDYFNEQAKLPNLSQKKSQQHYGVWARASLLKDENQHLDVGIRSYKMQENVGFVHQTEYALEFQPLTTWLRWSQGFKAASLSDLYSPVVGNVDLKDERNTYYEWGVKYKASNLVYKFLVFQNNYKDLIEYRMNEGLTNVGQARVQGTEISSLLWVDTYQFKAFINYWDTKNLINKKRLTLRPQWLAGTSLSQEHKSFKYTLMVKYIGQRVDFSGQTLKAYSRWDLYLRYKIKINLDLYANFLNVLQAEARWAVGYSAQPREMYLGLSHSF